MAEAIAILAGNTIMSVTPPACTSKPPPPHFVWTVFWFIALALAATTFGSFWIDECVTARFACHTSLLETWRDVLKCRFSEVQMPFYVSYVWGFEKLFGHSEFALRLSSLPFYVGGMTMFSLAFARRTGRLWPALIAIGLSPFAWYYLNEARSSAMQMGVTAAIVASLIRLSEPPSPSNASESRWLSLYLISVIMLSGISMLGQMWAGAALLAIFVITSKTRRAAWWDMQRGKLLVTAGALLLLGCYYLWTLTIGARATAVGTTNLQTILFIFYEQLGFVGPGPGRVELRTAGASALLPYSIALAVHALLVGLVLLAGLAALWRKQSRCLSIGLLACVALPAGLILIAGQVTHFRVLGRHFAPLSVILFLILSIGLLDLWQLRARMGKMLVAGFTIVTLASCLLVRFSPRHEKDNCRQAASLAKEALAGNKIVWWNAGDMAATYYGVPVTTTETDGPGVHIVINPQLGFELNLPQPDIVIASKADVYDKRSVVAAYLKKYDYQPTINLMAFSIWQKSRDSF